MDEAQNEAGNPQATGPGEVSAPPEKLTFWKRGVVIIVGTIVLAGVLFPGLRYLARTFTHEWTDDAFLDGTVISIAPRVAGQVKKVHVENNQLVKAGDLLAELDTRDFAIQLEQKKASVESARANVEMVKSSLDLFRAQIATAEATAKQSAAEAKATEANTEKARLDLKRAEELVSQKTISSQEFDNTKMAAAWAEANLKAGQEKAASDASKVAEVKAELEAGRRAYERGEAQERQAKVDTRAADLNLSYTRLTAPEAGYVTKKNVEDGNYAQVGQSLMALVSSRVWVTANFKETQLQNIRPGQAVKITVDSVDGRTFAGHVQSIMAGSGARFSLLPPENAVGNFVKVVQRVPVKILFDEPIEAGHVLGPGLSVVPVVRVKEYEISDAVIGLAAGGVAVVVGVAWWGAARKEWKTGET